MLAMRVPGFVVSVLAVLVTRSPQVWAEEDYQQWSVQTYVDEEYTLLCNDSLYPVFLNPGDQLTWRRNGHASIIESDDHFQLGSLAGVLSMGLTIKKVTEETEGIYFCEVHSQSGKFVGRVVKGVNLGGQKYHDAIDKYRRKLITGAIAGGSVMVFILAICAVDRFRYQSEDERREKREAREERLRRQRELQNGGHDNLAMEITPSGNGGDKRDLDLYPGLSKGTYDEVNTQL